MNWSSVGRFGLWFLTIFLASLGGTFLQIAVTSYSDQTLSTFVGLFLLLTAAAIYRQRLRW